MFCPSCGAHNAAGTRYCTACGAQLASTPPVQQHAQSTPVQNEPPSIFTQIAQERTGIVPSIVVFALCAAVSWLLWAPLSIPPRLVNAIIPDPQDCTGVVPGTTGMYACSSRVAAVTLAGPLIIMVGMFVFRRWIMHGVRALAPRLPEDFRFLAAPLIATMIFVIPWAGVHYQTSGLTGILPQKVFPAVIGIFTFAVVRYGPALQRSLSGFFEVRDQFPQFARIAVAILIPMLVAFLITRQDRVTNTAEKEQFIVLLSLAIGFLALTPRSGDITAGARDLVSGPEQQTRTSF